MVVFDFFDCLPAEQSGKKLAWANIESEHGEDVKVLWLSTIILGVVLDD